MNLDKKTAKRLILLCAVVLVIAMLCIGVVPKVELKSVDGHWRAVFFSEYQDCGWEGMLVYEGKGDVRTLHVELLYNGEEKIVDMKILEEFHGKLKNKVRLALRVNEDEPVFCEMIAFADEPKEITFLIQWEENGKKYETTLEYSK